MYRDRAMPMKLQVTHAHCPWCGVEYFGGRPSPAESALAVLLLHLRGCGVALASDIPRPLVMEADG